MGLGKYLPKLEELAKEYVRHGERGERYMRNLAYSEAVDFINSVVGDNARARGYLIDYFTQKVVEYRGEKK